MTVILEYDAGNLTSVARAVRHVGGQCEVTDDRARIADADRVIFPGVGAAGSAMDSLKRRGLVEALTEAVDAGKPVLAICIGCQVAMGHSDEDDTACLNLLPGDVVRLTGGAGLKIPHMGWNSVAWKRDHAVTQGLTTEDEFYFVHSFRVKPANDDIVIGESMHGEAFPAVLGKDNLITTQFHPEKSGRPGLKLIENFLAWNGS